VYFSVSCDSHNKRRLYHCNRDSQCFLWGRSWIFKYYISEVCAAKVWRRYCMPKKLWFWSCQSRNLDGEVETSFQLCRLRKWLTVWYCLGDERNFKCNTRMLLKTAEIKLDILGYSSFKQVCYYLHGETIFPLWIVLHRRLQLMSIQTVVITLNWRCYTQLTESSSDCRKCSNHEEPSASEVWI
jgi:hypothetical protein